ncbi:MAG: beta-propeller fold lactonase family protein, partial [Solirubrobacterales bacterium]|nr:beta-propeller fold lactonase family protein [Solirubrobacterales bacterium]
IAVSPDGKSVYVTNSGANGAGGVSQYDVGPGGALTPKAVPTVAAGVVPAGIAVSPDGKSVYVTNSGANGAGGVSQYDVGPGGALTPKAVPTVAAGVVPAGIAVSPDGKSVYVANSGANGAGGVSQYDVGPGGALTPKAAPTVAGGNGPYGIAVSPDGHSVYVTNQYANGADGISQYDVGPGGALSPKAAPTVAAGNGPAGIAVTPDGKSVYVTNFNTNGAGGVSQYDVGPGGVLSPKATATVAAGNGPLGVAVVPDQSPVSAFSAAAAPAGAASVFDGSASSDADGTIARYDWSFGDGTTLANAGRVTTHVYATAGTYTVRLTVTDDSGCSILTVFTGQMDYCSGNPAASTTHTVTVAPAMVPPIAVPPTTVRARPRVTISHIHARPLARGCVTEIGRDEREIRAVTAEATCRQLRLTLSGTITIGRRSAPTAGGRLTITVTATLPNGQVKRGGQVRVRGGRWQISIVLPALNLDPVPPRYSITIRYHGDLTLAPASAERQVRMESERAGL